MALTTIRNNGLASDAGGRLILLEEDTTGASNVGFTDVTLSQSADYDHQILVVNGYYHNDSTGRDMSWFMVEGGSKINGTGSYASQRIGRRNGVATEGSADQSSTQMRMNWYTIGNAANEPTNIFMKIFNSHSTSLRTALHAEINGFSSDGNISTNYANSIRLATTVCEKIRMQAGAGNMSFAQYRLYGVKA